MKTKANAPATGAEDKTVNQKTLFKKWQKLTVLFLAIISLASVVFFTLYVRHTFNAYDQAAGEVRGAAASEPEADGIPAHYIRRQLDGTYVEPEVANMLPVAVMIDNDPHARPQGGLAQASLVYEARAESNITRYLAFFADLEASFDIGPVRSARPYFLDWERGVGALYAHVGGSPQALERIETERVLDINEYYNEEFFWRSPDKVAPHNVYTSTDLLREYLEANSLDKPRYRSWKYKDDLGAENRPTAQKIEIDYGVFNFSVAWVYDRETNSYARQQAGVVYTGSDGATVQAKNVIIMYVDSEVIDSELRREMATIGSGKALYCFDGSCQDGVWRKASSQNRERIYTTNNAEVVFNAGTTWVQVVQDDVKVVF